RDAVLGWMLGALHAGQSELLRRQDELQHSVVAIVQHLQSDAAARLASQEQRIDRLAEELRRLAANQAQAPPQAPPQPPPQALPRPPASRPPPPQPPPRPARAPPPAPEIDPARSLATAAWLLNRIDKITNDNKSSIRSVFSRFGSALRRGDPAAGEP